MDSTKSQFAVYKHGSAAQLGRYVDNLNSNAHGRACQDRQQSDRFMATNFSSQRDEFVCGGHGLLSIYRSVSLQLNPHC